MQMENENQNTEESFTKEISQEKEIPASDLEQNNSGEVHLVTNSVPLEMKSSSINEQEIHNNTDTGEGRSIDRVSTSASPTLESFEQQQQSDHDTKEITTEDDISESPFAFQSLVDVPDFEFMGLDGSYQDPF